MDLKQLRYFSTVAQLQNFSRASELLRISQSSLSKQIAKLEAEIGVLLFDRNGKNIQLNAAGMRFYEYCTKVLRESKTVEDDIRFIAQSEGICIRIGAAALPEAFWDCIASFHSLYPNTEYVLTNRIEDEEHLDINEYDVLICPDEYRFKKLNGDLQFTERYYFAFPAGDQYKTAHVFTDEMLTGRTLAFIRRHHQAPDFSFRVCSALAVDAISFFFTDTREAHRQMIASGMAAGFVPHSEIAAYQVEPRIRLLPVLNTRFHRPMKICFLRDKYLSDHARQFRTFVKDFYADRLKG